MFPLSLLGFFTVLSLWLLVNERWALGGAAAAVGAASYHIGLALIPIAALYALLAGPGIAARERVRRTVAAGGTAALGAVGVAVAMWAQAGRPDAFFLIQGRYDHGLHWPTEALTGALKTLVTGPLAWPEAFEAVQTLFVTVVLAVVALHLVRRQTAAVYEGPGSARPGAMPSTRTDWLLLFTHGRGAGVARAARGAAAGTSACRHVCRRRRAQRSDRAAVPRRPHRLTVHPIWTFPKWG